MCSCWLFAFDLGCLHLSSYLGYWLAVILLVGLLFARCDCLHWFVVTSKALFVLICLT